MILEGRGLACAYGPTRALDGVSFAAGDGVLAVFGPNGAGKSTLLRVLAGERRPDAGEVLLDGVALSADRFAWRARIGVAGHRSGLYAKLTVAQNLLFFASLHGRTTPGEVRAALAAVEAERLANRQAGALSRGERQRAALARALMRDPELLLLDEPFTGLDASSSSVLETALRDRGRRGRIVVLVTHDIARGAALADRVVVLRRGRKALDLPEDEASPDRIVAAMGGREGERDEAGHAGQADQAGEFDQAGELRQADEAGHAGQADQAGEFDQAGELRQADKAGQAGELGQARTPEAARP